MTQVALAVPTPRAYAATGRRNPASLNAFLRRLQSLYPLEAEAAEEFAELVEDVRTVPGGQLLLADQQPVADALILLEGLGCHCRIMENGRRQMTGVIIPGDFCDYGFLSSSPVRQSVYSVGPAVVGRIDLSRLSFLGDRYPGTIVAVMRAASIDQACSRELAVSLGARDAIERVAYFLCEVYQRMRTVGLVDQKGQFALTMTQAELGESLGLSTVHVNRTIQLLRRKKLIAIAHGSATILDLGALAALASFDGRYLKPS
jgi:CRP-like cAMP-binding protein